MVRDGRSGRATRAVARGVDDRTGAAGFLARNMRKAFPNTGPSCSARSLPIADLDMEFRVESIMVTVCLWKGQPHYDDVVVGGAVNQGAAWYYPRPSRAAEQIVGHVAF